MDGLEAVAIATMVAYCLGFVSVVYGFLQAKAADQYRRRAALLEQQNAELFRDNRRMYYSLKLWREGKVVAVRNVLSKKPGRVVKPAPEETASGVGQ